MSEPVTLAHLLAERASVHPDRIAYHFLRDGEEVEASLSYGELHRWATRLAATVRSTDPEGGPVVLLLRPGLAYIAALFACWYAGRSAVPGLPPAGRAAQQRAAKVIEASGASLCLIDADLLERCSDLFQQRASGSRLRAVGVAPGTLQSEAAFVPDAAEPALIQFTSGTTQTARGVVLTHANLLHNQRTIQNAMGHDASSVGAGWLPPHHDMGLIGLVLQPLFVGFPCVLFSPAAFAQRPMRWLQAISRFGATSSGGPTFAYELCVAKTSARERKDLDLSRWNVAFVGAEAIRSEVLDRFARAFEPCGFESSSFLPCYGLAEAALMVTAARRGAGAFRVTASPEALERSRVASAERGSAGISLVSSGRLQTGQLAVVDPQTLTRLQEGHVGEIWLSGPSVAAGYWQDPPRTRATFAACIAQTGEGPYLRTGDLGALLEGELIVTGRLDDMIQLRGQNLFPDEIERTAQESHPALRHWRGAVFELDGGLVLVQEVGREEALDLAEIAAAIRSALTRQHGLGLAALRMVRKGAIPRTSSGKVRRKACREAYRSGELDAFELLRGQESRSAAPADRVGP